MKTVTKTQYAVRVSLATLALLSTAACGVNSYPTKKYAELERNSVGANVQTRVENTNYAVQTFVPVNFRRAYGFRAGYPVSEKVNSFILHPMIALKGEFDIVLKNQPAGMELKRFSDPERPYAYLLTWSPSLSIVPTDEPVTVSATFVLQVKNIADSDRALLAATTTEWTQEFTVTRGVLKPSVEQVIADDQRVELTQGEIKQITVTVTDPTGATRAPVLNKAKERNGSSEGGVIDATTLTSISAGTAKGAGKFEYTMTLTAPTGNLPGNDPSVPARMIIYASIPGGVISEPQIIEIFVKRNAQPAATAAPAPAPAAQTPRAAAPPVASPGANTVPDLDLEDSVPAAPVRPPVVTPAPAAPAPASPATPSRAARTVVPAGRTAVAPAAAASRPRGAQNGAAATPASAQSHVDPSTIPPIPPQAVPARATQNRTRGT